MPSPIITTGRSMMDHSKNIPCYGGTKDIRLLSFLLRIFLQALRNLLTQTHFWIEFHQSTLQYICNLP